MTSKWLAISIAGGIAALLLVWIGYQSWFAGRPLDSAAWQDAALVKQGVRLRMADRIVATQSLRGKTRAEVVGLLGEPPASGSFQEFDLVYWLGPERGFMPVDSEWLVLRLDSDGKVSELRLLTD